MSMELGDIAKQRLASIESNVSKTNNASIELPEEISSLIAGEAFREARINRYKMLIRQGHLSHLLEIARYCRRVATKNPAFLFAKMASKAKWEQTIEFAKKLVEAARVVAEAAQRLSRGTDPEGHKAIYKAYWHLKGAVVQKAALAAEIVAEKGGNQLKLFNYLCWKT